MFLMSVTLNSKPDKAGSCPQYTRESHQRMISCTIPDTTKDEAAPSLRRPMLGMAFPLDVLIKRFSVIVSYTWSTNRRLERQI